MHKLGVAAVQQEGSEPGKKGYRVCASMCMSVGRIEKEYVVAYGFLVH